MKATAKTIGTAAAWVSAVTSLAVTMWSYQLAASYLSNWSLSCGTPSASYRHILQERVQFALIVPFVGWWIARKASFGVPVARCAAIASIAAWFTALHFATLDIR